MAKENPFVTISILPETRDELRAQKENSEAPTYDEIIRDGLGIDVSE